MVMKLFILISKFLKENKSDKWINRIHFVTIQAQWALRFLYYCTTFTWISLILENLFLYKSNSLYNILDNFIQ